LFDPASISAPYRRCENCGLVVSAPRNQRDHRCPRCLLREGRGIEMRPELVLTSRTGAVVAGEPRPSELV
jgi:uncharacterized paraquat-inducible protein A